MSSLVGLKKGAHIHLMGICGTAMASLAGLLKDRGFHITGSDQNPYPPMSTQLEKLGIQIQKGYQASNLNPAPDFVIVGNVISASNAEAQELKRLGLPFTSLAQAMGEVIIGDRESVCISGTHGKTTTTSMMAWIMESLGEKPGFLIGGIPKNFSQSFQNPQGKYFVIEGDEYDTAYFDKVPKFTHYKPRHVILTSVEFDHADIYKDLDAVKSAFRTLATLIPKEGTFLYAAEDMNIASIKSDCKAQKSFGYGFEKGDYLAKHLQFSEAGSQFEVIFQGTSLGTFEMVLGGKYNVMNAVAVIGLCHQLGLPLDQVKRALKSFEGVKRRQEVLGEPRGILIVEDFAHHPTAVRETLQGIFDKYKGRAIHAVFEPRSATSRRKIFQKEYARAFEKAAVVYLAQAFDQGKIDSAERFSSDELVQDLKQTGQSAAAYATSDEIVGALKAKAKTGDLIIIMSNGGFDGIYQKLLTQLA